MYMRIIDTTFKEWIIHNKKSRTTENARHPSFTNYWSASERAMPLNTIQSYEIHKMGK